MIVADAIDSATFAIVAVLEEEDELYGQTEADCRYHEQPSRPRETGYHSGMKATILSGPPLPPAIFIGRAIMKLPVSGSRSRFATFSNPGIFAP